MCMSKLHFKNRLLHFEDLRRFCIVMTFVYELRLLQID